MQDSIIVGIDLAKNSFQIHEATRTGRVLGRKKVSRGNLPEMLAKMPKATIFMEACGGAHYWARKVASFGHTPKLIPPQYVKPFVKRQKNDSADAEAICEAGSRENMHFVPVKTIEQQDLQALHRIRSRYVENRTALYNQIRGLLHEYGIIARQGMKPLRDKLTEVFDGKTRGDLSEMMLGELKLLQEDVLELDKKVAIYDKKVEARSKDDDRCVRLMEIPGIGPITATALVAAVGNAAEFKNSRQFSAHLGLVPRQNSTGGKTVLGGLSKQGDKYLRTLLIHGGRAVLMNTGKKIDPRSQWAEELKKKVGMNKAAVAMANKNARTVWALLRRGDRYDSKYKPRTSFKKLNKKGKDSPPAIQSSPSVAVPITA